VIHVLHRRIVTYGILLAFIIFPCFSLYGEATPELSMDWDGVADRVWIGPEFWANRLQDWRVHDERLECVEAADNKPLRAVHTLTHALADGDGAFTMSVLIGPMRSGTRSENTWAGFLIGAGGPDVDYRLTALTHHWTGEDGGLIAAIDGTGRVIFRDNTQKGRPELNVQSREGRRFEGAWEEPVRLDLSGSPTPTGYALTLMATGVESSALIGLATLTGVDPKFLSGSLALVSHHGPGYWFDDWTASGDKITWRPERMNGPVLAALHTLSRGTLKLTAQFPPIGAEDSQTARLEIQGDDGAWTLADEKPIVEDSYTATFRVENWDGSRDVPYRVVYDILRGGVPQTCTWNGTIRKDPVDRDEFTVAAFTGHKIYTGTPMAFNSSAIWFPHNELVAAVKHHKPDFLFFSGGQIYESDYTGAQREPIEKAMLDYLDKWYRWCWVFGDLARDVPSVAIPDDHDVYHGNIWGAGGRHAEKADDGGFTMPPRFVNMVQRTQVSHLPDPVDPAPVEQGITVYFTDLVYGGISFAILEDRKFKSSPTAMIPEGNVVNGFFHNPDFDPATQADVEGAVLLGERQLKFLDDWANAKDGAIKIALSQTVFNNVSTLPRDFDSDKGTPDLPPVPRDQLSDDYKMIADGDSNGWPQSGRNAAVRALRKANAFHICGDQHLGIVVRYGVDTWNDAGFAFCVPAIGNTWPRRWYPPVEGGNRDPGRPPYTGEYRDAFGNYMTILAAANPLESGKEPSDLYDRATGYGIVRINKSDRTVRMECWPRWVDPSSPGAEQYPDWPVTVDLNDGSVEY
jgi:hypothetical protein